MNLTPEQIALLPSDEDVAFYREHGWWIAPPFLSEEELDNATFGADRYYAGERDSHLTTDPGTDWTEADGNVLRQNDYVSLQVDELKELVHHPLVAAMAARLSGSSEIRLFHDQLVYKPPDARPEDCIVGWHTDLAYWPTCTSTSMLTAWIPFQDCSEEMGPMAVLDRSHRWQGNDGLKTFHDPDLEALEARIQTGGDAKDVVLMTLKRGQASFHHCRTVHASFPNTSDRPRLALAIHVQDGENRYRRIKEPSGKLATHINDILCRKDAHGDPDYADPAIFPLLWSGDFGDLAELQR